MDLDCIRQQSEQIQGGLQSVFAGQTDLLDQLVGTFFAAGMPCWRVSPAWARR